jgi:prepilin-type processing-associated H-X9-DG protein
MARTKGLTLAELLATILVLAIGMALLLPALRREREVSHYPRCRNQLNQLAKGMATYLNECGDNRFYPWPAGRPGCGSVANPRFGGAEWLATLYWTRIIPDPGIFTCPASPDSNEQGIELGTDGTPGGRPLSKDAVSYAAMGDLSVGIYLCSKQSKGAAYAASKLAIRDDFPPNEPMACDDTDDPINHGEKDNGHMNVLFFDSHVECWTHTRVDLEAGVGQGDLCALRN